MVAVLGSSVLAAVRNRAERYDPIHSEFARNSIGWEIVWRKGKGSTRSTIDRVATTEPSRSNVFQVTSTPKSHMRIGKGNAKEIRGGALCDIEEGRGWLGGPIYRGR
ncbi:unnamed protein product [Dovyalis caffra]|uniref:Uncharacterized protein n=1 Tax=Dovyalis caffra TaxID=77055 RepID=A0AAV1SIE6_9ROSI|nr:unnamed protein product [Dovyalis caffra]